MRSLFAIFVMLHGLVHLWYFSLSRGLVAFKPEMGWSGRSWLFTSLLGDSVTRSIASVVYLVASVAFLASGVSLFARVGWWRPLLTASSCFSAAVILLFWDGRTQLIVQRGLIGFLINLGVLLLILVVRWPSPQ
jgi:hypothetical protein